MRSAELRLRDILDAIVGVRAAIHGLEFAEFAASWTLRRAVERGIEIISEASRRLPQELKSAHPDIPWDDIAGIGNILRHDYARVEDRIVWNVATRHLDPLERAALAMLEGLSECDRR